jgi:hypothetical protein
MSLLPQRKKSAEEIAKLREELGIPGSSPGTDEAPAAPPAETAQPNHHPVTSHSLKRSERPAPAQKPAPAPRPDRPPKPVRSLRKSERAPLPVAPAEEPNPHSKLPLYRHSEQELAELRRNAAIAMMAPVANPKLAAAHPVIIVFGYLLSIAGTACFYYETFPIAATAGCAVAALVIAAFIFLRRPNSRHHAGFITVIALFVLVFAVLHYFPQLRHAT